MKKLLIAGLLAMSFPASALAQETKCQIVLTGNNNQNNFWVTCYAKCPEDQVTIGGSCDAADTRGHGMALDSIGLKKEGWLCRWVDIGALASNTQMNPDMTLYSRASCASK